MIVNVGHEELPEMAYDRTSNTFIGNPFDDGFRFDIA